jgi:hypothetical protein
MVCGSDTAPDRGFFRLAGIEYSPAPCQATRTVQKKHSPKRDRPAGAKAAAVTMNSSTGFGTILKNGLHEEAPVKWTAYLPPAWTPIK